jgi:hypothetical protein
MTMLAIVDRLSERQHSMVQQLSVRLGPYPPLCSPRNRHDQSGRRHQIGAKITFSIEAIRGIKFALSNTNWMVKDRRT